MPPKIPPTLPQAGRTSTQAPQSPWPGAARLGLTAVPLTTRRLSSLPPSPSMSAAPSSPLLRTFTGGGDRRPSIGPERTPSSPNLQQLRSKFTMSDAQLDLKPENFRMFMQAIRKTLPGMENAEFTGFHGTSEKRAQSIIKNGPDLALAGKNWGNWSQTDEAFHTSWQPDIAMESAEKAAKEDGCDIQFVVTLRKPGSEPMRRASVPEHRTGTEADEVITGDMAIKRTWSAAITKEGRDRQNYTIVALPAFGMGKKEVVKEQLAMAVKELEPLPLTSRISSMLKRKKLPVDQAAGAQPEEERKKSGST